MLMPDALSLKRPVGRVASSAFMACHGTTARNRIDFRTRRIFISIGRPAFKNRTIGLFKLGHDALEGQPLGGHQSLVRTEPRERPRISKLIVSY